MQKSASQLQPAALGLLTFAVATALRVLLQDYTNGPFITYYPAVILASLAGGWLSGLICAAPSFFVGLYFFTPSEQTPGIKAAVFFSIAIFVLSVAIAVYQSYRQEKATALLQAERDRSSLLFEELQHRVANNMMLVAKLLDMQRRELPSSEDRAKSALREARQRIEAFSKLHRTLHNQAIIEAPATAILAELTKDLLHGSDASHVHCEVQRSAITLDMDRLTCVALITSEALTNAIKYAFSGRDSGRIDISLDRQGDAYILKISDDGVGRTSDETNNVGVGTRIMQGLTRQLGGQLDIDSGVSGTHVSVLFPACKGQVIS